jgi:hypothetical protein
MPAIILTWLPVLVKLAETAPEVWGFIKDMRAEAQRDTKWTPEQRAQFDQTLVDEAANPPDWLKTDAQRGQ